MSECGTTGWCHSDFLLVHMHCQDKCHTDPKPGQLTASLVFGVICCQVVPYGTPGVCVSVTR